MKRALALLPLTLAGCISLSKSRLVWHEPGVYSASPAAARAASTRDGFVYGVDVHAYRSIVFLVNVANREMCDVNASPPESFSRPTDPSRLNDVGAELQAGLRGLAPEARFSIITTGGGQVSTFVPETSGGRAVAEHLASALLCQGVGTGTLTWALTRAFAARPEVIVLLGDSLGDLAPELSARIAARAPELLPTAADPLKLAARLPPAERAPVIAVALGPGGGDLEKLALLTGGSFVRVP